MGKHDDSSRVLSRRSPDSHAAGDNAVDLAGSLSLSPLLVILFHIAEGRFVRQGSDGSRPEGLPFSEDYLRVIVGAALVFS